MSVECVYCSKVQIYPPITTWRRVVW